jgi:3-hydroxybutyrate dehydrogenase
MMAELDFSNKSVVITGSSRGIGFGVAEAFASHGADLHLISSGKTIHEAGEKLTKIANNPVKAYQCDISDKHKVVEVLSEIETIDVLINNAGLERPTPINSPDPQLIDDFERIININVLGTFYVTRASVAKMSKGGSIIITSSIWGKNSGIRV